MNGHVHLCHERLSHLSQQDSIKYTKKLWSLKSKTAGKHIINFSLSLEIFLLQRKTIKCMKSWNLKEYLSDIIIFTKNSRIIFVEGIGVRAHLSVCVRLWMWMSQGVRMIIEIWIIEILPFILQYLKLSIVKKLKSTY